MSDLVQTMNFNEEIKEVNRMHGRQNPGNFIDDTQDRWFTCREQFADRFTDATKVFGFSIPEDTHKHLAKFIYKFEILTGCEPSQFQMSNRKYCVWMHPSKFWTECPMRRSLLTIILRSGAKYDPEKDNFMDALFSDSKKYSENTKIAITRFLIGFNIYRTDKEAIPGARQDFTGWYSCFRNKNRFQVKRQLVSDNDDKSFNICKNALWT